MTRGLSRFALTLWLGVIAVFGVLRFWMRASGDDGFAPDAVAWAWLTGGVVVGIATVFACVHAVRSERATR